MTAVTARHPRAPHSDTQLLRFAIRADATLCAGVGLFAAMAADPLSRLTGLSATAEWMAGASLVVYGVLLYSAARVRAIRRVGAVVVAGNVVFTAAVAVVLAAGWLPLTPVGVALIGAFAAVTVGLAYLQYLGMSHIPA